MEGVEDGEDVVGGYEQGPEAEEGDGPGDAEQEQQAQDGQRLGLDGEVALNFLLLQLEEDDLSHGGDEHGEAEEEDHGVVADVHPLLDVGVGDPAAGGHEAQAQAQNCFSRRRLGRAAYSQFGSGAVADLHDQQVVFLQDEQHGHHHGRGPCRETASRLSSPDARRRRDVGSLPQPAAPTPSK